MRLYIVAAAVASASAVSAAEPVTRVPLATCPGRGYVPYSYPAVGSCPCAEDGCYHPRRYYSCDDRYEKSFWRRWARAHFCGGSMLDGIPCRCIHPPGRAVMVPAAPQSAAGPPVESGSIRHEPAEAVGKDFKKSVPEAGAP